MLRTACRQLADWQAAHPDLGELQMSVNVSGRQLASAHFADDVARALAETGLAPRSLSLEITESVLIDDAAAPVAVLRDLRATGLELALDDFGTGYSSLSYLRRFPLDRLKIDRSFVAALGERETDGIVEAIVRMAQSLGLGTVAEGVEDGAQLAQLRGLGCTFVQGYHLGRPLPAGEAERFLLDRAPMPAPA